MTFSPPATFVTSPSKSPSDVLGERGFPAERDVTRRRLGADEAVPAVHLAVVEYLHAAGVVLEDDDPALHPLIEQRLLLRGQLAMSGVSANGDGPRVHRVLSSASCAWLTALAACCGVAGTPPALTGGGAAGLTLFPSSPHPASKGTMTLATNTRRIDHHLLDERPELRLPNALRITVTREAIEIEAT